MKVLIACVITLSLISSAMGGAVAAASSTPVTNSFTSASFNSTPVKILNVANSTTGNIDAAWTSYMYGAVGPAAANTSIYLWGYAISTVTVTTISRKLNATIIAYGNDTTEMSTVSGTTDMTASCTLAASQTFRASTPVAGVAPGALAIAGAAGVTMASGSYDYLVLMLATPGACTTKTVATATVNTGTNYYTFAVNQVWYEDSCWYILYELQTETVSGATYAGAGLGVAFYCPGNTTIVYTGNTAGVGNVATANSVAITSFGNPVTAAKAQNSNITNSTSIYVIWNDMSTTYTVVKTAILARYTGVASTAAAALVTGSSTSPVYYASGIVTTNSSSYGWIVGSYFSANTSTVINAYYGTATSYSLTNFTLSSPTSVLGAVTAMGFSYAGTGYAVLVNYAVSGGMMYALQTYLANGTVNSTAPETTASASQVTLGTFASATQVSAFKDMNGAFWLGWVAPDMTASSPIQVSNAYAGIALGQTNGTYSTSSSAGSILASLAALVSFVIMSLFMF